MNRIISSLILICGLVINVRQSTPAHAQDDSYTLVLLPDAQYYASEYPDVLKAQTQWIAENRAALNIVYVAGLGDLTNLGDSEPAEWQKVAFALPLDDLPQALRQDGRIATAHQVLRVYARRVWQRIPGAGRMAFTASRASK